MFKMQERRSLSSPQIVVPLILALSVAVQHAVAYQGLPPAARPSNVRRPAPSRTLYVTTSGADPISLNLFPNKQRALSCQESTRPYYEACNDNDDNDNDSTLNESGNERRNARPGRAFSRALSSVISAAAIFSGGAIDSPANLFDGFLRPQAVHADARLNAPSAAGTRVNSDPDSLLRYGLPIPNAKEIRDIQGSLESCKMNLKTRRVPFAKADLNNFQGGLKSNAPKLLKLVAPSKKEAAQASLQRMIDGCAPLFEAMALESASGSGSLQEREGLDNAFAAQDALSKELTKFEEYLVPETFKRTIPDEYKSLPALQGRATVEMVIKKPDGSKYDVDGKLYDQIKLKMVIDGYNAPITGGNFVDLVNNGFYKGKKITRSDGFVIQTGDANPEGEVHGYVPPGASEERKIPLEISLKGDKELLYGISSEDDGRGYAAAVLPFQSTGALGMARTEFEADSASSQFFWLLFESDLTPAGKNLLDGRYANFGYTIEGADLLKGLAEGDVITSATVVEGLEKLSPAARGN